MNIEERITKLEKQNKKLRAFNVFSVLLVSVLLFSGFQQQLQLPNIIKAKGFILLDDDNKERATLTIDTTENRNSPKLRFYNEENKIITSIGTNKDKGYISLNLLGYNDKMDSTSVWLDGSGFTLSYNEFEKIKIGINDNATIWHFESINNSNYTQLVQRDSSSFLISNYFDFMRYTGFTDDKYQENIFKDTIRLYDMYCRYNLENNVITFNEICGNDSNNITKSISQLLGNFIYQTKDGNRITELGYTLLDGVNLNLSSNEGVINLGSQPLSSMYGLEIKYNKKDILTESELFFGHKLDIPEENMFYRPADNYYNLVLSGMFFNINDNIMYQNYYDYQGDNRSVSWKSKNTSYIKLGFANNPSINLFDNNYNLRYSTTIWGDKNDKVSTTYYDENGKPRLNIGNTQIKYKNGTEQISPTSSIHLFNENGNVIEELPR